MKKVFYLFIMCLLLAAKIRAQVSDPNQVAQDAAASHANNDMSNAANSGLNGAENGVKGLFSKKKKDTNSSNSATTKPASDTAVPAGTSTSIKEYRNYDFVPGEQIIFQSQLEGEHTGEIPSQFTLNSGQFDTQNEDGQNLIHVPEGPGANFTPRMKKTDYMPDQFTVEFDAMNERFGTAHIDIQFGEGEGIMKEINFGDGGAVAWSSGDVDFPASLNTGTDDAKHWHHIAIAVNKNQGKIYVDQYRVANVNNLTGKASSVTFNIHGYETSFYKNIRIAAGGIDVYKKISTDSKIVMHGILFDVDKATLKPESMGSINQIYSLMQKDATLKFQIDGFTDNSGTAAHNLTLSGQRADAVKAQLVSMGIETSRLTTKGFGDSMPIDNSNTPEAKANNRRVEFVKK